jgi:hypothetical protein
MVLVDPSFPNQTQALDAASPTMKRFSADAPGAYRLLSGCVAPRAERLD